MSHSKSLSRAEQLERLSALIDGELTPDEASIEQLDLDEVCCAELKCYHLIGDVMRDSQLALSPSDLFSVRLAKAIADEPAHTLDDTQIWAATGTDDSFAPAQAHAPQAQALKSKPTSRLRLALVSGGVAAAVASVFTYTLFNQTDVSTALNDTSPVLAAHQAAESEVPAAQSTSVATPSAPALLTSLETRTNTNQSTAAYNEAHRRTYPTYIRSHSDLSAQTPFVQVNYTGTGIGQ